MSRLTVKAGYKSSLSVYDTQMAIGSLKSIFEGYLSNALNLKRVSAPLMVSADTGLNDDLNGIERPVEFDIMEEPEKRVQIVHSLAKWKRMALYRYGFPVGEGLYTDMNAIRRDEDMDNLHSIYVDQWDWEMVISKEDRALAYLKQAVQKIVDAICKTSEKIKEEYPQIKINLSNEIAFITTQELENIYPELTPKERENEYLKEHKTAFIMQIGGKLSSGMRHDGRAPDYDDWSLNGDIVFWNDLLGCAFEISSMGIRVDKNSLDYQLREANCDNRREFYFHKMLLEDKLPLTMGGGIGQSRLCMLLLEKMHIGEVQASIWDKKTVGNCKKAGIELL